MGEYSLSVFISNFVCLNVQSSLVCWSLRIKIESWYQTLWDLPCYASTMALLGNKKIYWEGASNSEVGAITFLTTWYITTLKLNSNNYTLQKSKNVNTVIILTHSPGRVELMLLDYCTLQRISWTGIKIIWHKSTYHNEEKVF